MPLFNPDIGLISHIRKHSTEDGPGVRNTVLFKGCPMGCLWCSNPELIRPKTDLLFTQSNCTYCGACIEICPNSALSFNEDDFIVVNRFECTACGECVSICPENAFEMVGVEISVDNLVTELLQDKAFYRTYNGGVTFSGGEPLFQAGFIRKAAEQLKKAGIHVVIATAGDISWCRFEEVLDVVDLVLFSFKVADRDLHQRLTGKDNDLILANLRMLALRDIPTHIRMDLIPGINDSLDELHTRMELIHEMKNVEQIDLLPYSRCAAEKYTQLGLDYPLGELNEYSSDQIETLRLQIASFGIPVTVYG